MIPILGELLSMVQEVWGWVPSIVKTLLGLILLIVAGPWLDWLVFKFFLGGIGFIIDGFEFIVAVVTGTPAPATSFPTEPIIFGVNLSCIAPDPVTGACLLGFFQGMAYIAIMIWLVVHFTR